MISRSADVARLASCTRLGGVTIRSGAALDISQLRALTTITGDLVIGPTVAIEDATFRALRTVDGAVHVASNGILRGIYFPSLERAGAIEFDGNAVVATISLPKLQVVHGELHITDNAAAEVVDLSSLSWVDHELVVTGDPRLALLDTPKLWHVAEVRLDAPKLPAEVVDHLRAAVPSQ